MFDGRGDLGLLCPLLALYNVASSPPINRSTLGQRGKIRQHQKTVPSTGMMIDIYWLKRILKAVGVA